MEERHNELRKEVAGIDVSEIYRHVDTDNKGYITSYDIEKAIGQCPNDDIVMLIKKYDRDLDGRIRRSEFIEELKLK